MFLLAIDNNVIFAVIIMAALTLLVNTYLVLRVWKSTEKNQKLPTASDNKQNAVIAGNNNVNNADVVAVITAAITVILDGERQNSNLPKASFIVKKIKKI